MKISSNIALGVMSLFVAVSIALQSFALFMSGPGLNLF
jgi:hypothetical protein